MKTRHTSSIATAPSVSRARVHAFLAVVGVITAMACALILLQEVPAPHAVETSKLSLDGVSKLTTLVRVASFWQF